MKVEVTVNQNTLNAAMLALDKVGRHQKVNIREVKEANKQMARRAAKIIKSKITKGRRVAKVRRKSGPDYDVARGTLRRSIGIVPHPWGPGYIAAPKSGLVHRFMVPPAPPGQITKDGFFAPWIEEGKQHFGGHSPNRGFMRKARAVAIPLLQAEAVQRHKLLIGKLWK